MCCLRVRKTPRRLLPPSHLVVVCPGASRASRPRMDFLVPCKVYPAASIAFRASLVPGLRSDDAGHRVHFSSFRLVWWILRDALGGGQTWGLKCRWTLQFDLHRLGSAIFGGLKVVGVEGMACWYGRIQKVHNRCQVICVDFQKHPMIARCHSSKNAASLTLMQGMLQVRCQSGVARSRKLI